MRTGGWSEWTTAAVLAVAAVLGVSGCGRERDRTDLPVAEVDGRVLTAADLRAYLNDTLHIGGDRPGPESPELNAVQSRLFDRFVEEELLLAEADRVGIEVSPREIEAYLGEEEDAAKETGPTGPGGKKGKAPPDLHRVAMARRHLAIRKLLDRFVLQGSKPTPKEVDAYLVKHRESLVPGRHLVLHSLMLSSLDKAKRIRNDIRRRRLTFDEAVVRYGSSPGLERPVEVTLESLPEEVRDAVRELKPKRVSRPVLVGGNVYLFMVEAWSVERAVSQDEIRRRAREALAREKTQHAASRLIREVRARTRLKLYPENLPFPYISEEAAAGSRETAP